MDALSFIVQPEHQHDFVAEMRARIPGHPRAEDCDEDGGECMVCALRDCPRGEPLHYHHDGCPRCSFEQEI